MRINIKNLLFFSILFFLFIITSFLMELKFDIVGFTFLFNALVCLIFIGLTLNKEINVILFYYIFNLCFMSFIPWINYTNNIVFWSPVAFSSQDYLIANFSIFIFNIFVFIFYTIVNVKFNDFIVLEKGPNFIISMVLVALSFLIILYAFNFDLQRIFFRGVEGDVYVSENANPFFSIFVMLARLLPAFILMRYLVLKDYSKSFFIFIFVLLCAFPTGVARFLVAFIYLPIFLIVFPPLRKSINITLVIILSLIFVFPFLNQFRYFSNDMKINFIPDLSFFNQAHFDAYQNLVEVLRIDFITYGYQLLGVLFFFIPRKFWPEKPTGSGHTLSIDNNYPFSNISMPFIGESYVNFGYLGFIIFSAFLAFLMKKVDLIYLIKVDNINFNYCKGVFLCSAIFFMLRGDLMSSFSFLLAGIVAFKIAEKI